MSLMEGINDFDQQGQVPGISDFLQIGLSLEPEFIGFSDNFFELKFRDQWIGSRRLIHENLFVKSRTFSE